MWILKTAASAVLVLAGAAIGLRQADRLEHRCLALQDVLLFLQLIQVRMQNSQGLWLVQLAAVAADVPFAVLRPGTDIPTGDDLQSALQLWLRGANAPQLLGEKAYNWLVSALVSAATRQETAARLDYYYHLLEQELQTAQKRCVQDRKLYMQMGPLAGALLAVILW